MFFLEAENILVDELIYAKTLREDFQDYIRLIQELDSDEAVDKQVLEEVYLNLKFKDIFCVQVILSYNFLFDKWNGNDLVFYEEDLARQIDRFFSDENLALALIENFYKVFRNKKRFEAVFLSLNDKEKNI